MRDDRLRAVYDSILARRPPPDTRAGCPAPERLRELVESGGAASGRMETLDHVMSCAPCKEEYDFLWALHAEAPARRRSVLTPSWIAMAAAALLAVSGGIYWSLRPTGVEPLRGDTRSLATISPAGTVAGSPNVKLVWNAVAGTVAYRAELLDAGGSVVITESTSDTTLALPATLNLAAGAQYRWWVSAELTDGTVLRSRMQAFQVRR